MPCVTSPGLTRPGGALFQDMPANVFGSLAIGLFSSGEALLANYPGSSTGAKGPALAMLPRSSSLQLNTALHVGLRTGFCGSLTTYASWMLQMVTMFVPAAPSKVGPEWVAALWGLAVNVIMSMGALVIGQHLALGLQAAYVTLAGMKLGVAAAEAVEDGGAGEAAEDGGAEGEAEAADGGVEGGGQGKGDGVRRVTVVVGDGPGPDQSCRRRAALQAAGTAAAAAAASDGAMRQRLLDAGPEPQPKAGRSALCWAADAVVLLVFVFLTAISITYITLDGEATPEERAQRRDLQQRNLWFAVLLGPLGCLLRWWLSKFNGQYGWWPMGTFAANVTACVIDFIVQSIILRAPTLTPTQTSILAGIVTGVSGCLSTVSTWVVEIQALNRALPGNWRGYSYALGSMATTVALGLAIYGTAVWTM